MITDFTIICNGILKLNLFTKKFVITDFPVPLHPIMANIIISPQTFSLNPQFHNSFYRCTVIL